MNRQILRCGLGLGVILLLGGCSSGGSGGGEPEEVDDQVVENAGESAVMPGSTDDEPAEEMSGSEFLSVGATRTGSVIEGESQFFIVPSDAEVSVISSSGNPDLFLYDNNEDFNNDRIICGSAWSVLEDNCTATHSSGVVTARVFGRSDADFSISVTNDCSVAAVNEWVYRNMQDYYVYADRVPVVNPADYATSQDLVRDLRFNELEPFSSISDAVTRQEFFESGADFGFGARFRTDADGTVRVSVVFEDSPFGRANIQRGDIVVGINGEAIRDILADDRFREVVGDRDNPLTSVWGFIDVETGDFKDVSILEGEFTVNSVLFADTYDIPSVDGPVGYLVFSDFIETSEAALDSVFTDFAAEGVSELILDLRYNSGGRVSIANKLASQIGGTGLDDFILSIQQWNSKYTALNTIDRFEATSPSLDLNRLVVLTTLNTASASERVINSLKPYMEVTLLGDTTGGKPFTSRPKVFCGQALSAMHSQNVNANSVSVAGGIPADCQAFDDFSRPFGRSGAGTEGMLQSALDYVEFGTCVVPTMLTKRTISSVGGSGILDVLNRERRFNGLVEDTFNPQ